MEKAYGGDAMWSYVPFQDAADAIEMHGLTTDAPKLPAVLQAEKDRVAAQSPKPQVREPIDGAQINGSRSNGGTSNPVKPKRSTTKGEARVKLIAALTTHHKYADGGCLNLTPIGNNELARLAKVSDSTASAFFNREFNGGNSGGLEKYQAHCRDSTRLVGALKLLNQEFSPHHLYGDKPPGEAYRDED
jgi:hypothetical protein